MPPFARYLVHCARDLCRDCPELWMFVQQFRRKIVEPDRTITMVDLSCYPTPHALRWESDRGLILEMLRQDLGAALSTLTFEQYRRLRENGRVIATYPVSGIYAGMVNLFPVPAEEVLTLGHEPVMLSPSGTLTPISHAAWVMRVVEDAMSEAWMGFAFLETLSFLHGACVSDVIQGPEGHMPIAHALRTPHQSESAVAIRVCVAHTRLEIVRRLFPSLDIFATQRGTIVHADALNAYAELALQAFEAKDGPPKHALEAKLRKDVAMDVAHAHGLPTELLAQIYWNALNGP